MPIIDPSITEPSCKVGTIRHRLIPVEEGWRLPHGFWDVSLMGIESGGAQQTSRVYRGSAIIICSETGGMLHAISGSSPEWQPKSGEHAYLLTATGKPIITIEVNWTNGDIASGKITQHRIELHKDELLARIIREEVWQGNPRKLPRQLGLAFHAVMDAALRKAQCVDCQGSHYTATKEHRCPHWKATILP